MSKKQYNHEWFLKNKERINKANREWYYKNRESVLKRLKKWRSTHIEEDRARKKGYRIKNQEKLSIVTRDYIRNRKDEVKVKLGGKCGRCNFSDIKALQVHHKVPKTKTRRLDYLTKEYNLDKVELVCANCHAIEHYI